MLCLVADAYGWQVEKSWESNIPEEIYGAVRRLEENWKAFSKGEHSSTEQLKEQKKFEKLRRKRGLHQYHKLDGTSSADNSDIYLKVL